MNLLVWITLAAHAQDDGPIGEVGQGLVSPDTVNVTTQEELGLVTVNGGCSGTLINQFWVLTAHHCLTATGVLGDPLAGSNFPVEAAWSPVTPVSTRVVTWVDDGFDVALLYLGDEDFGPVTSQAFHTVEIDTSVTLRKFGRGLASFATVGPPAMPSVGDGLYRTALFTPSAVGPTTYTLPANGPNGTGPVGHGGDSGGPDFVVMDGLLVGIAGIQSTCDGNFAPGKSLVPDGWAWATSMNSCNSVPLYAIRDQILATAAEEPYGVYWEDDLPDPSLFPQPIWLYSVTGTGSLMWTHQLDRTDPWEIPRRVGVGWGEFVDVVPAGGTSVFTAHPDGTLSWYRHDGFAAGTTAWSGGVPLRDDWTYPVTIGGGDGVLYAIDDDGTLVWYRYDDYLNGGTDPSSWSGPEVVGWGWDQFDSVVSTGEGTLYAALPNGDLWIYHHDGWQSGTADWSNIRKVGNGWNMFDHLVGLDGDALLGVKPDGSLWWYHHLGQSSGGGTQLPYEVWEGQVPIGGGFGGLPKVFALIP